MRISIGPMVNVESNEETKSLRRAIDFSWLPRDIPIKLYVRCSQKSNGVVLWWPCRLQSGPKF